jgi:hypothetical protein
VHGLTLEVGGKGTLSVGTIEKGSVSICAECTRKDADVAKHALQEGMSEASAWIWSFSDTHLQRFIQDIGHLVLKVTAE